MSDQQVKFEQDGLSICASRSGDLGNMVWRGSSDARDPGILLNPVARRVVEMMDGAKLTVDFRSLEYMNSSTVSSILYLLKALDKGGVTTLVLFSDADWQVTHLRCMRTVTRVLKHVTVEGRPA